MALSLAQYRSFFDNTVYKVIEKMNEVPTDPIFSICGEEPYDVSTGDTMSFTSEALDGYAPVVAPGGEIPNVDVTEGDTISKTFVSFKDKIQVEWETALHNKLGLVLDRASDLSMRCNKSAALALSRQLLTEADASTMAVKSSNGTATETITTADGQPLASASHTVPGDSNTYTNLVSGAPALSEASLSTSIQVGIENTVSDAGTMMDFTPDCLIVPRNELMIRKAQELTGSNLVPESNNNAINVYTGGRMKVVVLPEAPKDAIGSYDSDNEYRWMVADSRLLKRAVRYAWAARPNELGTGLVPKFRESNLDSSIYVASRFLFVPVRWQGIVYSLSTTAPTLGSAA